MNDLEARRALLADPRRVSAELQERLDADPRLAAFRDELLRLDDALHGALTQAAVPEGLADRLVLHSRFRDRSRWGLALAAAIVALAVAVPAFLGGDRHALEHAMIAHVIAERGELEDDRGVEERVLREAVAVLGVNVNAGAYRVRHLANCVVAGREGRHFTVDGPRGVVTFIVLPGGEGEEPVLLQKDGTRALFLRRAGNTVGVMVQYDAGRGELERLAREVVA